MNFIHKKIAAARANLPAQNKGSSTRANLPAKHPAATTSDPESREAYYDTIAAQFDGRERELSIFRRGLDARELALDSELASITKLQTELYDASAGLEARELELITAREALGESIEYLDRRSRALVANEADWNNLGDTVQELHAYMHGRKGLSKASLAWIDAILAAT